MLEVCLASRVMDRVKSVDFKLWGSGAFGHVCSQCTALTLRGCVKEKLRRRQGDLERLGRMWHIWLQAASTADMCAIVHVLAQPPHKRMSVCSVPHGLVPKSLKSLTGTRLAAGTANFSRLTAWSALVSNHWHHIATFSPRPSVSILAAATRSRAHTQCSSSCLVHFHTNLD